MQRRQHKSGRKRGSLSIRHPFQTRTDTGGFACATVLKPLLRNLTSIQMGLNWREGRRMPLAKDTHLRSPEPRLPSKSLQEAGVLIPKGLVATRLAELFSPRTPLSRTFSMKLVLYLSLHRESYGLHTVSQTSQCPKSEATEGVSTEQMRLKAPPSPSLRTSLLSSRPKWLLWPAYEIHVLWLTSRGGSPEVKL